MNTAISSSIIGASVTFLIGVVTIAVTIWQLRKDSYSKLVEERRILMMAAIGDSETRKWLLDNLGLNDIPAEKEKLYLLTILEIDHYQQVYYRYKRHLFPKELWPNWRLSMSNSFKTDLFKEIWDSRFQDLLSKEFKDYKSAGFPD
jgi:hypothetical protein